MAENRLTYAAAVAVLYGALTAVSVFAEAPHEDSVRQISLCSRHALNVDCRVAEAGWRSKEATPLSDSARPTFAAALTPKAHHPDAESAPVSLVRFGPVEASELLSAERGGERFAVGKDGTAAGGDWSWRRAGTAEEVVLPLAIAGTIWFEREYGKPAKANWTARNGFDESVRDVLRLKSESARSATHIAGDTLMWLMIAAPVVDSFATLGVRDSRWDALWQTSMINVESFAFTSVVSSLTQNLIRREKPYVRNCRAGKCEDDQFDENNRSMASGHVAFAFTGAGLVCNHHQYQYLYGDKAADDAVCAASIGVAALDGVLRVMADRHYATDVIVGTAIGWFSGFVLPRLLHYSRPAEPSGQKAEGNDRSVLKETSIRPMVISGGAGLNCDFRF